MQCRIICSLLCSIIVDTFEVGLYSIQYDKRLVKHANKANLVSLKDRVFIPVVNCILD